MKTITRLSRTVLLSLTLALGIPTGATAQTVPGQETFPALGAPDDPKVVVRWNHFYDVAGLQSVMRAIHAAYPELTELVVLGTSYEGREIVALEVTNEATGPARDKPAMYIDGNIHGNEVQAGETVLYTAWYLTETYGRNGNVTRLLDEKAFYLVPTINPDGRDHWFHDANTPHSNRGGRIPVDNDGDGRFDEDGPEDLDGDGSITRMRIEDPWGRWKVDPDHPALMVRVARDERGTHRLLGSEGIDNDGDGEVNEDGPGGYDPNRNWPWTWQPEGIQYGARDYPFSLPETRAVGAYVQARPNIAAAQSYHNAGGMILRGPGQESGAVHGADEALAAFIAERGESVLPFYDALVVHKDLYTVWGGEFEWFYGGLGIISFTNELWTRDNLYRRASESGGEGQRESSRALSYLLQDDGLTPWAPYEHPDYGTVEIGGTAHNWGRVPPSFMLEEELHRNMAFTLYHAECMPLVRLGVIEVTPLADGVSRVRVPVENHGVIPTRSGHDVDNGITPRNTVTLDGVTVLAAGRVTDPDRDVVAWQSVRPERVLLEAIPGLDRVFVEFLVTGSGTARVEVNAVRGGAVSGTVEVR